MAIIEKAALNIISAFSAAFIRRRRSLKEIRHFFKRHNSLQAKTHSKQTETGACNNFPTLVFVFIKALFSSSRTEI